MAAALQMTNPYPGGITMAVVTATHYVCMALPFIRSLSKGYRTAKFVHSEVFIYKDQISNSSASHKITKEAFRSMTECSTCPEISWLRK